MKHANIEESRLLIQALEQQRRAALAAGDLHAFGRLMAEDLVHVHTNGVRHDKAQLLAYLANTRRQVERGPLDIRVYGDMAIVTGAMINVTHREDGSQATMSAYATQVVRRDGDGWRFVSFHASPVALQS